MSKDNISLNDILEEFSPDGHKVDTKDTAIDNKPKDIPVETPKSLEQLELESLEAISQGELSDSAINYSSYTNKPNRIIKNPTQTVNQSYNKGVVKINSRPEPKKSPKKNNDRIKVSDNQNDDTSSTPKKRIDSRNSKIKSNSVNDKKRKPTRNSNDSIQQEDFNSNSMAETLKKAKAKKQLQIDELNSQYILKTNQNSTEQSNTVSNEDVTKQNVSKDNKKTKKSLLQKIVDYYTIPVTDDVDMNQESTNSSDKDTISEKVQNPTNDTTPKKKESFKDFVLDLFTSKEKPTPKKKETFKQRMIDFFTVEDDENVNPNESTNSLNVNESVESNSLEIQATSQNESSTLHNEKVSKEIDNLLNNLVDGLSVEESAESLTPIEETIEPPIPVEETPKIPTPVEETPKIPTPVEETPKIPTPVEETPKIPTPVEETPKIPTPIEETPKIPTPIEETPKIPTPVEETPKIPTPVEETPEIPTPVEEIPNIPTPVEETPEIPTPVEEIPNIPTPVEETPKIPTPVEETPEIPTPVEEIPNIPTPVEEIPVTPKKPNIFRRIKMFFLAEELSQNDTTDDTSIQETPQDNVIAEDTPVEETSQDSVILEDTPVEETPQDSVIAEDTPVEETPQDSVIAEDTPIEETPQDSVIAEDTPVEETPQDSVIAEDTPVEETPQDSVIAEDTPIEKTPQDSVIFNQDNFDDETSIDIPIDEPVKYKHFWQDPDFNPIDRIKSYVEDTTEKYKNRKRSGEIHIEIKSNPDTAILFSGLEDKILAEEEMLKSREEFKKQVENGEYDNYEETLKKSIDDEPTFQSTSINDFNSYSDKSKIESYVLEMKNNLLIRTIITSVLCIISLYTTLANDLGLPIFDTLNTQISSSGYLMVQSLCGLIAILTSVKSIMSGIIKIFKRKSDSDSFASIGIVSAFISSLLTFLIPNNLLEQKMLNIYMPIALIGVLVNLIGKTLIVKREETNFKYISKDKEKCGLFCIQDDYDAEKITKGLVDDYPITSYKKKSKFTSDFIKYTYSYDMADKFSKFAVPIICIVSLITSLIFGLVYNKSFGMMLPIGLVSIFSMLISFCSCFSIPICINSMLYRVSKKYTKREGVLLGYQAVEDFYDTNSIIVSANDIFPKGSINISALKLFSNAKLDDTLIYTISLANEMNSILAPTLLEILDGRLDMLCEVQNCSYEDGLGICGWIDNKRILMGNRELMEFHNIENLPSKSKEMELVGSNKDCIYVSISGNLALMLIVNFTTNPKIRSNLINLQRNNIAIAVTSCDFLVSVNKIRYLYGIEEDGIKIIPYEVFNETKEYFKDKPKCSTSIVTNGDIGMITNMLMATKKIHRKSVISNMLNAVSCILGVIIGISFITMGGFKELTSAMVLLYNLICAGVTMLICSSKKF